MNKIKNNSYCTLLTLVNIKQNQLKRKKSLTEWNIPVWTAQHYHTLKHQWNQHEMKKGALKRIAHSTSMFSCDVGGCSGCLASPLQFSPDVALVSEGGAGAGLGLGFCKILDTLCSKLWKIKL